MKIKNLDNVIILRPKKSYFNDGSRFEGQSNKFRGSKLPDGYGKLYYPNGHIQYKGNFKNGMYHGYGEYFNPKLWDYLGYFFKNRMHGKGKIFYKRSKIKIDGIFKNNIISEGKAIYKDGSYFVGKFKNFQPYIGKRIDKLLGREFTGILHNNSLLRGVLKFSNGDIFKGEYKKNEPYKKGIWYYPDKTYEGEFKSLKKADNEITFTWHGEGKLITSNYTYRGKFKNHKFHGWGIMKFKGNHKFVGKFKNHEMYDGIYTFVKSNKKSAVFFEKGKKTEYL